MDNSGKKDIKMQQRQFGLEGGEVSVSPDGCWKVYYATGQVQRTDDSGGGAATTPSKCALDAATLEWSPGSTFLLDRISQLNHCSMIIRKATDAACHYKLSFGPDSNFAHFEHQWSPDDQYLAVLLDHVLQVYRVDPDTCRPTKVYQFAHYSSLCMERYFAQIGWCNITSLCMMFHSEKSTRYNMMSFDGDRVTAHRSGIFAVPRFASTSHDMRVWCTSRSFDRGAYGHLVVCDNQEVDLSDGSKFKRAGMWTVAGVLCDRYFVMIRYPWGQVVHVMVLDSLKQLWQVVWSKTEPCARVDRWTKCVYAPRVDDQDCAVEWREMYSKWGNFSVRTSNRMLIYRVELAPSLRWLDWTRAAGALFGRGDQ